MSNLTHYIPSYGYTTLRRDIDRLFDQMMGQEDENRASVWSPRTDVTESDDQYTLRMDVPGLSKDTIHVEVHDNTLTVRGERQAEHREEEENFHRVERTFGQFYRSMTLPRGSNAEKIEATLQNGVLTLQIPKREETKPRRIEVSDEEAMSQSNGRRKAQENTIEVTSDNQ